MKIHSVYFGEDDLFQKMGDVLKFSAQKNSPNTPFILHRFENFKQEWTSVQVMNTSENDKKNTLKTKYHNDIVQETENGEFICLMDLDMAILGDLSEAEGDYDLGVTVRKQKTRINSGVIFVRVSDKTKQWYQRWYNTVNMLLADPNLLRKKKKIYSAINQSGLGVLLENPHDVVVKEFEGAIWNCTPVDYRTCGPQTKVIHLLNYASALKEFRKSKSSRGAKVAKAWLNLEQEMLRSLDSAEH